MKEVDLAYFAGLFDGEGHVRIGKDPKPRYGATTRYYLQVIISNQNLQVLEELQQNFGGSIHGSSGCYHLAFGALQSMRFLEEVKPYIRIKLPQVEVALEFQRLQIENGRWRTKKTPEHMLILDGYKKRLEELKQIDKQDFKTEFTFTGIQIQGGIN